MIVKFKSSLSEAAKLEYAEKLQGCIVKSGDISVLIVSNYFEDQKSKLIDDDNITEILDFKEDWPLASRVLKPENTTIDLGDGIEFGTDKTVLIAGPCAAESEKQLMESAEFMRESGVKVFRAGLFKPRTSAYAFDGLGDDGIKLLMKIKQEFGMKIITEVYDSEHFESIAEVADIIQVGSKAMFNLAILKRCGKAKKPVLLKRNFSATSHEWIKAAEVILAEGNPDVILCERGIRTFETSTRFTLDLNTALYAKEFSHLPLLLDPSHAFGHAYGVPQLALAAAALSVDSIMLEVHPCPNEALCDKNQALSHEIFSKLVSDLRDVCQIVGRTLI